MNSPIPSDVVTGLWDTSVPPGWTRNRIRYLATIKKGRLPTETFESPLSEDDLPYLSMEFLRGETLTPYYVAIDPILVCAEADDILLLWDGSNAGEFLRAKRGVVSSTMARLQPLHVDPDFLFYACKAVEPMLKEQTVGMGIPHVNSDLLKSVSMPLPSTNEQRAIAAFLNRKMTSLTTLVAKKRELIEKLTEKRTALISRTVTRGLPPEAARAAGLDPHPKLKPSGIEWLGEVPEHWDVVQLFRVTAVIQTGPFGSQLHQSDYVDEGVPLINPSHLIEDRIVPDDQDTVTDETARRLMRHRLMAGDVVFARRGEIGRCAVVGEEESGWLCGTGSMIIRLRDCDARYFARVFRSAGFSALLTLNAVGTTMLNLNPSIVGRMRVPLPPLPEQCAISDYLDRETSKMDRMVEKVEAAIERLQEYRAALITAAVTGKIDVRTKH